MEKIQTQNETFTNGQIAFAPAKAPIANPEQARINRPRTSNGDRVPTRAAFRTPTAGHVPARECDFIGLVSQIEEKLPFTAAFILHEYNDKLLPAYDNVVFTDRNAREELVAMQRLSSERDELANRLRATAETEMAESLAPIYQERDEADRRLIQAAEEAGAKAAEAGGSFDRENPSEESILLVLRLSPEEAAAELMLPYYPKVKSGLANVLTALGTGLIGTVLGLSMALAASALEIERIGESPAVAAFSILAGISAAGFMRYAVLRAFEAAGCAAYARSGLFHRVRQYTAAFAILAACIAIDVVVEREGLLKLAGLQNATASLSQKYLAATPAVVLYLLGALLTVGYLCYSALEGHHLGVQQGIIARIRQRIEERFANDSKSRRSQPVVQEAIKAFNRFLSARRDLRQKEAQLESQEVPFKERVEKAEALRIAYPIDFSLDQKQRMQDALDQYAGTQAILDYHVAAARLELEGGFLNRLRRFFMRKPRVARG